MFEVFWKKIFMRRLFFFISILIITAGCSKEEIKIDPDNLMLGTWVFDKFDDNSYTFYRSNSFVENHCYKFNSDGTLTERKNSGWCGTPPVSYADYSGTWTAQSESEIEINVGYWGGSVDYFINILKLDKDSLKVTMVYKN